MSEQEVKREKLICWGERRRSKRRGRGKEDEHYVPAPYTHTPFVWET